jgi:putative ABC transport system permease protein
MSGEASGGPRLPHRLLRRLLPGPVGSDALADLEREHERFRQARGPLVAWLWYTAHLLRPGTWALARALRRTEARRPQAEISRPAAGGRLGISWLDVKLGLRMLAKYPGLTFVSGLAMSVTIAVAIGMFGMFQDYLLRPVVPLPEGERIVSLGMLATERGLTHRQLLHDFFVWRDEMETVEGLSLWRRASQNLVGADGRGEPASIAMMSASGFEVARVPPLMGRPLLDSDEVPGAPPVLVIGYDAWQRRFEADPDVVGRTVQLGRTQHTVVGVMPEGFRFPLAEQLWTPFADDPDDWAVMETPYSYFAFGRLAPGVTMAQAQAELSSISNRRSAELPDSHEHVRAIVMSYTDTHTGMDNAGGTLFVRIMLGVFSLFVLIPFMNVAILVYARTATRAGEISIRSALGASRRRVVTQLFVEALVLASLAAAAGVGIVLVLLAQVRVFLAGIGADNVMPFWAKNGQDPWALAYVVALTVLAAVVAGVIPGLKATGKHVREGLARAGSGSGMRLGRGWTALVITQVAITVAFLPLVGSAGWGIIGLRLSRPTFDAESLIAARISGDPMASLEGSAPEDPQAVRAERAERTRQAIEEVARRIEADPRVADLTFATGVPGTLFEASILLEVEGVDPPMDAPAHRVGGGMSVAGDFFEVVGVTATSGRTLVAADARSEAPPVVVNRSFADRVLGGANPVGRRVRWHRPEGETPEPWREIVGLVENMVRNPTHPESIEARIFMPLRDTEIANGVNLIVRVPGAPEQFVPELRRIATAVDPTLRMGTAATLGRLDDGLGTLIGVGLVGFGLVFVSVLLLCSAGVFALMSFSVTQRRREIGVRSALGAEPRRVLFGVIGRAARQLAIGVALGLVVVIALPPIDLDGITLTATAGPIGFVALVMAGVGLLAAIGPARRGLRIHPSEALREG